MVHGIFLLFLIIMIIMVLGIVLVSDSLCSLREHCSQVAALLFEVESAVRLGRLHFCNITGV